MKEKAIKNFRNGYSCSESIVKAAIDNDLCEENIFPCATPFSGGMSSGCLCGAIAGSQIIIGRIFGKNKNLAKEKAKIFIDKFKEVHGATCCRVLSKNYEFHSPERRKHCEKIVEFSSKLLEEIIKS